MNTVNKVVIIGGGTAGWMAGAALSKLLGDTITVTLVESNQIPTVGVGEATIPTLHVFHRLMGINERELMSATNATFKLGIEFENWRHDKHRYIHSFGNIGRDTWACGFHHFWLKGLKQGIVSDLGDYNTEHYAAREGRFDINQNQRPNYALHLDAALYAKYLRSIAEQHHIKRTEGKVVDIELNKNTGFIKSILLASGKRINGDLFIDCTGFSSLLMDKKLHVGFEDWGHHLPCDRAVAVQTDALANWGPYTRSVAHSAGWKWHIPLQNRTGNGLVFCSHYMSEQEAIDRLLSGVKGKLLNDPKVIQFQTGMRPQQWYRNCVAIGLSGGFIEPLESTGIHLFQRAIIKLMQLFPTTGIHQAEVDEFNQAMRVESLNIRDFIVLHYHQTQRRDSEFWRHCQHMAIPSTLKTKLDMFSHSARLPKQPNELFDESSWVQVMMGQGVEPRYYHPVVDRLSEHELQAYLDNTKNAVISKVNSWPKHDEFITQYCPMLRDKA